MTKTYDQNLEDTLCSCFMTPVSSNTLCVTSYTAFNFATDMQFSMQHLHILHTAVCSFYT